MDVASVLGEPDLMAPHMPLALWFRRPEGRGPTVVSQLVDAYPIDETFSDWFTAHLIPELRKRHPEGAFSGVHDWGSASSYTVAARARLTQWTISERKQIDRVTLVIGRANPLLRLGVSTARLAMRAAGMHFDTVEELGEALSGAGLSS